MLLLEFEQLFSVRLMYSPAIEKDVLLLLEKRKKKDWFLLIILRRLQGQGIDRSNKSIVQYMLRNLLIFKLGIQTLSAENPALKPLFNSPKRWRVLIPSFSFLLLSSAFCLLLLLTSFYFDQTFHKSFQLGLAWFSLTQLGSA